MTSSLFGGMMVGAMAWGTYADKHGRHGVFQSTLLVTTVAGLLLSGAPSFLWACVWSAGVGVGVGGSMPIDGTLLVESLPSSQQPWLTALSVFFALGSVVCALLAYVLLPGRSCLPDTPCNTPNVGWRYLMWVLAAVTLGFALLRLWGARTYESPAFLLASGRTQEAEAVVSAIALRNGASQNEEEEEAQFLNIEPDGPAADHDAAEATSLRVLWAPAHKRTTLVLWALWAGMSLAYTMFNAFYPLYLQRKTHADQVSELEALRDLIWYALSSVPGSLIGAALLRTPWGQHYALPCALGVAAAALGMFAWTSSASLAVATGMAASLATTTAYAILYGITPDAFPTLVRGSACAVASALGRVTGMLAPLLAGALLPWGLELPVMLSMLLMATCSGLALVLPT